MKAIIDCNSFYCSCERLFKPALNKRPIVVLSNNDGCIIARTDEAKSLGIDMGGPYFLAKPMMDKQGVIAFSSNYHLYGDLSWRVMETLRQIIPIQHIEVYSVDESFLDLSYIPAKDLAAFCLFIKDTVEQWTGIKVSIGVAPTKVLSKVANRLAKKNKEATNCILILDKPDSIKEALKKTPVEDIWGIGHQYAYQLRYQFIHTAYDLSTQSVEWAHKRLGGVVGSRLIRELKGIPSIGMMGQLLSKKMIATTRMFGKPITELQELKEAVATYASRAAEKLRRQHSAANTLTVLLVTKENPELGARFRHGQFISSHCLLPLATANTQELIKPALAITEKLFEKSAVYKKAGIILSGILPDNAIQANLFTEPSNQKNKDLMKVIDNINFSMRDDLLKFAALGSSRNWKMRQSLRSPRYTTRWEELCLLK